jgi:hypothetical protein
MSMFSAGDYGDGMGINLELADISCRKESFSASSRLEPTGIPKIL